MSDWFSVVVSVVALAVSIWAIFYARRSAKAAEESARADAGILEIEKVREHVARRPVVSKDSTFYTAADKPPQQRMFQFAVAGDYEIRATLIGHDGSEREATIDAPKSGQDFYKLHVETQAWQQTEENGQGEAAVLAPRLGFSLRMRRVFV